MILPAKCCRRGGAVLLGLLLAGLAGCGSQQALYFPLNMEGRDPEALNAQQVQFVVNTMYAAFGSPDEPRTVPQTGLDINKLRLAAGPAGGSGHLGGLYRLHCVHCHGTSGNGAGPTARFLNPYPRNFQKGIFKFTSTKAGMKPSRADLKRTLKQGIHGTAMPSFVLLPEEQLDALVEYVIYLAIRGQFEELLIGTLIEEGTDTLDDDVLQELLENVVSQWRAAEDPGAVLVPPARNKPIRSEEDRLAAVERGRKLYYDPKKGNCVKCHGVHGLGDGGDVGHDDWNKQKAEDWNKVLAGQMSEDQFWRRWLLPVQQIQPRNLRLNIYRGGRRPVDLYRRIAAGIKGTPMPAHTALSSEEIWDLVEFVRWLPYEDLSQFARPQEAHGPGRERL